MASETIRVGIVGAGDIARTRHIPGLSAQQGVEVVSVCNRSRESSAKIAAEFGVPKVYDNWLDLVQATDTDAIIIGTWPYMHCPVTLAALDNDKHVLCEGRMAMDAQEAQAMLDASRSKPHLVTQIVPGPSTFPVDNIMIELLNDGYLGDLLAINARLLPLGVQPSAAFINPDAPFHWRQDREVSGYNVMNLGIEYEGLMRWIGPATRVMANTRVFVKQRRDSNSALRSLELPDHIDLNADMACGAQLHMTMTAVSGLGPARDVWLFGTEGTIRITARPYMVFGGRRGDTELKEIANPEEKQYVWRTEEEFIRAIRGLEPVTRTPFHVGVKYMEFTEAVHRSAQTGQAVPLPL